MSWRLAVLFTLGLVGCNFSFNPDVDDTESLEALGPADASTVDAELPPDAAALTEPFDAALVLIPQPQTDAGQCDAGCPLLSCRPCDPANCASGFVCQPICAACDAGLAVR